MKMTQFTIGTSRTINLGNFESLRVESSVTMEVNDDDNFAVAVGVAQGDLRKLLEETYRAQTKKPEKKIA